MHLRSCTQRTRQYLQRKAHGSICHAHSGRTHGCMCAPSPSRASQEAGKYASRQDSASSASSTDEGSRLVMCSGQLCRACCARGAPARPPARASGWPFAPRPLRVLHVRQAALAACIVKTSHVVLHLVDGLAHSSDAPAKMPVRFLGSEASSAWSERRRKMRWCSRGLT
jgi:hypothetical protein